MTAASKRDSSRGQAPRCRAPRWRRRARRRSTCSPARGARPGSAAPRPRPAPARPSPPQSRRASRMPATAIATDTRISAHSTARLRWPCASWPVDLGDRRLEEVVEEVEVGLAEGDRRRNADQPGDRGADRQHHSGMVITGGDSCRWCSCSCGAAELAVEGQVHGAEHVAGGEPGGEQTDHPQQPVAPPAPNGRGQDLVLGEEAGERRDAGDRDGADQEGAVGRPAGAS